MKYWGKGVLRLESKEIDSDKFKNLSDDEIIGLIRENNKLAENYILVKYRPFIIFKVKDFYIQGGEIDDLIQEGMIGLYKGILSYKVDEASNFRNFVDLCIRRQVITAIRSANRLKNQPLNNSLSLNETPSEEDNRGYEELLAKVEYSPEDIILGKERILELEQEIKKALSPLEWKVVYAYIEGSSFEEISGELCVSIKSVYNAIDRSRKKILGIIDF